MSEALLTIEQFAALEGQTRQYVYRRAKPGHPHFLPSSDRRDIDGRPGILIDPQYLTFDAKQRLREDKLRNALTPTASADNGSFLPAAQPSFFPEMEHDRQAANGIGSGMEKDLAFRRLRIIQPCMNHDYAAMGFNTKGEFRKAIAARESIPERTQMRWEQAYLKDGLNGLINKRPGPTKGTGEVLDSSMRGYLYPLWMKGLTFKQCYSSLLEYLRVKQNSPGCRVSHQYFVPSYSTVYRFLESLGANDKAARQGEDALKAACGYLDRSYVDLSSLERVESDECKLNLFSYDPRRPVNRKGEPWMRRYWLLTFYDARSIYPLVWTLCEGSEFELRRGIAVEDEVGLFVNLIQTFGVPQAINSDRGRFRGKQWGGEPYQQRLDKEFATANGILQRVGQLAGFPEGIRHNMPRVHNPRGSRLERFHRFVADWFRAKPGWIGANTRERKMTRGDKDVERYKLWCAGKLPPGEPCPLLTREQILSEVTGMMEAWREHNSEGTDMHGMTPRAVFAQNTPASGFPKLSDDQLAFATAQHFENEPIKTGGIIELPGARRYSHPSLIPLAGQKREVVLLRHDHSFVTVLPAQKGEETIQAPRRVRVGADDQEELSKQIALQKRVAQIVGPVVTPAEYDPSVFFPEPEPAPKVSESLPPTPDREVSSMQFIMDRHRYQHDVKPRGFADLQD